jgi:dihydroorotate dehydrogenase
MFFISPPFGNYLLLPNTINIKGSYTLEPRPDKWGQIFKTLRYSYAYQGWINKIGLRNEGLVTGLKKFDNSKSIMSIAILKEDEIPKIQKIIPDNLNIELNVSCPNLKHNLVNTGISCFLNDKRKWCIIKLSPLEKSETIDNYYNMGFKQFHVCNTLPSSRGGISGKVLQPYTNKHIDYIKSKYEDATIIAGGGVTTKNDALNYINRGASYVSISTLCFNPCSFIKFYLSMKN